MASGTKCLRQLWDRNSGFIANVPNLVMLAWLAPTIPAIWPHVLTLFMLTFVGAAGVAVVTLNNRTDKLRKELEALKKYEQ